MPFIKPARREQIELHGLSSLNSIQPGDSCYLAYTEMVKLWKANPSWTTAASIYDGVDALHVHNQEEETGPERRTRLATELAWQCFFQLYVMPYELEKRKENGNIC